MSLLTASERRHFPDWDDPSECRYQRVTVDLDKCGGCRLCTLVCPAGVLELYRLDGQKKVRVKDDARGCISCNNCHAICDSDAIAATQYFDFAGYYRQLGRGGFSKPRVF
jgi:formate hydrogenlyase subunit 6/NADH:ubiquinone oxidoreductase subunit I